MSVNTVFLLSFHGASALHCTGPLGESAELEESEQAQGSPREAWNSPGVGSWGCCKEYSTTGVAGWAGGGQETWRNEGVSTRRSSQRQSFENTHFIVRNDSLGIGNAQSSVSDGLMYYLPYKT